jgi:hypothetical protein
MKLVLTLGSESPRRGVVLPLLKLAVVGFMALIAMNSDDIRRYFRLRSM